MEKTDVTVALVPGSFRCRLGWLDWLLLLFITGCCAFVAWRVVHHLHYRWQWDRLGSYLIRYDEEAGGWRPNYLLDGFLTTLRLSLYSGVLALLLGFILALVRTGRSLFGRLLGRAYVELMRNVPPLVIVFLVYFFLAGQITPLVGIEELAARLEAHRQWLHWLLADPSSLSAFVSAVATLALFESAYIAEIIRSGLEAVPQGQWEAGYALGLTRGQIQRTVVLPQAMRQILPPLAGQFVSLVKDSSIVSVISIQELTYQGTQLMASTYMTIEVWTLVAALYFAVTFPCSLAIGRIERNIRGVTV